MGCLRELSAAEQSLAVLEYLFGVTATPRSLAVLQKQRALGVENHGHPIGDTEQARSGAKVAGELLITVGPDLVLVALVDDPSCVGRGVVEADTNDSYAQRAELFEAVAEPATLPRSDGCPGIGEEPHHGGVS